MMGAVATGARAGGAHTLGVIPQSLVDLEVADTDADELVVTDGMASRKNLMIDRSDAFLVLPGGLGTLDELFEVWTTATLGLHAQAGRAARPRRLLRRPVRLARRLAGTDSSARRPGAGSPRLETWTKLST